MHIYETKKQKQRQRDRQRMRDGTEREIGTERKRETRLWGRKIEGHQLSSPGLGLLIKVISAVSTSTGDRMDVRARKDRGRTAQGRPDDTTAAGSLGAFWSAPPLLG